MRAGGSFCDRLAGLGKQMPVTSAAFVVGGLSLIGVPGTAGFISKWVLMQAAFERGWWWMALLIVASSLLAVVYVWKIVELLYMQKPADGVEAKEAPVSMLVPIWILAFACIWFGFDTDLTIGSAKDQPPKGCWEVCADGYRLCDSPVSHPSADSLSQQPASRRQPPEPAGRELPFWQPLELSGVFSPS